MANHAPALKTTVEKLATLLTSVPDVTESRQVESSVQEFATQMATLARSKNGSRDELIGEIALLLAGSGASPEAVGLVSRHVVAALNEPNGRRATEARKTNKKQLLQQISSENT